MMLLFLQANQAATKILNSGLESATNASGTANAFSTSEPSSFWLWVVLPLTVIAIWYFMTKKTYIPRRYRRTIGKGPLTYFRDTLVGKFTSFLS